MSDLRTRLRALGLHATGDGLDDLVDLDTKKRRRSALRASAAPRRRTAEGELRGVEG
jgi:hypothetical protein